MIKPDYLRQGLRIHAERPAAENAEEADVLRGYGGEIIFTPGDIVYSSSQAHRAAPPRSRIEKLLTLMNPRISPSTTCGARSTASSGKRVHVVGDTIVDSYTHAA